MARSADRVRRTRPVRASEARKRPTSLFSIAIETEPEPVDTPVQIPTETRSELLRKLSSEAADPTGSRLGFRRSGDATILSTRPPIKQRIRRVDRWMQRLLGGTASEPQSSAHVDEDHFDDIRGELHRTGKPAEPVADIHQAEKHLSLIWSKAGWLAEQIGKCSDALNDARMLICEEELRLARLRGAQERPGGQTDAQRADLDVIQEALERLRRMLDRLDEPR